MHVGTKARRGKVDRLAFLSMGRSTTSLVLALSVLLGVVLLPGPSQADGARRMPTSAELIGAPLPAVRARPVAGDTSLAPADHRGRLLLIGFFATWCRSCRGFEPTLASITENNASTLRVLMLSHETQERLRSFATAHPSPYTVAQCTPRTAFDFGARSLPTYVLADEAGLVRHVYRGVAQARRLPADIAALLAAD